MCPPQLPDSSGIYPQPSEELDVRRIPPEILHMAVKLEHMSRDLAVTVQRVEGLHQELKILSKQSTESSYTAKGNQESFQRMGQRIGEIETLCGRLNEKIGLVRKDQQSHAEKFTAALITLQYSAKDLAREIKELQASDEQQGIRIDELRILAVKAGGVILAISVVVGAIGPSNMFRAIIPDDHQSAPSSSPNP